MTISCRTLIMAAATASAALVLAGCSSPAPTPEPTASAQAACTPETSEITWQPAQTLGDELVGSYVLTYDTEGLTTELVMAETAPTFDDDALRSLDPEGADDALAAWKQALLDDLKRTGQVSATFGDPATLPEESPSELTDPEPGVFLAVVSRPALSVAFDVACDDGAAASGTLHGLAESEQRTTLVDCAAPPAELTPAVEEALAVCPA